MMKKMLEKLLKTTIRIFVVLPLLVISATNVIFGLVSGLILSFFIDISGLDEDVKIYETVNGIDLNKHPLGAFWMTAYLIIKGIFHRD